MPPKTDVKFNNQGFITSYITEIIELIKPTYDNILTLDTSEKSLPETIALLTGKTDGLKLTNLKAYQYNSLIPKIRLFRVNSEDDSEYEFIFSKDYKYNYLSENHFVGNNCGIKSINWILAGTNPASSEKTIEVKIEFYFDSINSFSGGSYDQMLKLWNNRTPSLLRSPFDNPTTKQTTNYWSLIYHPSILPDQYSSPLFRIKAIVGWEQLRPEILNEIFKGKQDINEEFYDSDLVMYLNLVQHNFAFNEDGSIKLTANYIASLENSLFSTNFDLLKGLKESLDKLKDVDVLTLDSPYDAVDLQTVTPGFELETSNEKADVELLSKSLTITQLERRIKFLTYLSNGNDLSKLKTELNLCLGPNATLANLGIPDLDYSTGVAQEKVQELLTTYSATADLAQNLIDSRTVEIKQFYYSQLIKELIKTTNGKNKIFLLPVDAPFVKQWLNWKNGIGSASKPKFSITRTGSILPQDETALDKKLSNLDLARTSSDGLEWLEGDPDDFGEAQQTLRNEEESVTSKRIMFTTFGYLIDAAITIIRNKYGSNLKELERNKILFSTFSEVVQIPNQPKNFSIADIPIEINFFVNFLDNELYEKGVKEYPLFKFIKDLTIKAAEPSLESREIYNGNVNKYSNTSLVSTIISLGSTDPKNHPLSDFIDPNTNAVKFGLSINKTNLKPFYLTRTNLSNTKLIPFNYFIVYDKFNKDFTGVENKVADEKRGIYHYTLAQDYGLVKSINFKKIDQPFLRESKSVGKKTIYLGQFRDLYNAEIKMIGNNIYYPGMMLFIKPNVEFGRVISTVKSAPTFAQLTGIGGYYTVTKVTSEITDEAYTTTLDCVFHSNDGLQPSEAESQDCNYTELEKAGLYDSSGKVLPEMSLILANLKEIVDDVAEQKEELDREKKLQQLQQDLEISMQQGEISRAAQIALEAEIEYLKSFFD